MSKHTAVRAEYDRFLETLPTLMETLPGRWVVFLDGEVKSDHDDQSAALTAAVNGLGLGTPYVVAAVEEPRAVYGSASAIFGL